MLKLNFRNLFLVLGVIILLFVFVSCDNIDDNILDNKDHTQDDEGQQNLDIENSELSISFSTHMTSQNGDTLMFRAEPYIQDSALSWEYSLDIKIEGDKIYINDTLYKESSSVPPVVLYSDGFLAHADYIDKTNNQEIANTLTKIKNCDSCYLLETNQVCKTGQKISVYEVDNVYYFIRFYDNGEVMRIHRAIIT